MSEYRTIEEIITQFNSEGKDNPTSANEDTVPYTYIGEHYDASASDKHWAKQFTSTELAVGITESISYAVRDGLNNADVATVLEKILSEVKRR